MRGFYSRAEIRQAMEEVLGGLLPGQTPQTVYEQSGVQRYAIGSRLKLASPDGRIFRYSRAEADLAGLARLAVNSNYAPGVTGHEDEDGFEGVLAAAAPVGATHLDLADTALRARDYYQGGYVAAYGVAVFHQYHIARSDPGNGTYVRVHLTKPVAVEAITVAMGVTAYLSPYGAVAPAGSVQTGFESFVGLNLVPIDAGRCFWLQTGGPAIVTPTGGVWPGSAANLRDIYANPADGTIQPPTLSDPSLGYQRIGTLLSATGGTASDYGDLWIMLELEP